MTPLTESRAAEYLGIPEKTLRNARYRKKISYTKYGKEVRYSQKQLDDYTASCTHTAGRAPCGEDISYKSEPEARSGILPGPWEGSHFVEAQARKIAKSLNKSSPSSY